MQGDFCRDHVHFDEVTAHLNREDSELLQVIVNFSYSTVSSQPSAELRILAQAACHRRGRERVPA